MNRYLLVLLFLAPLLGSCQLGSVTPDPIVVADVELQEDEAESAVIAVESPVADPLLVHSVLAGHEFSNGLPESLDNFLQQQPLLPYVGDFPMSDHPRVMAFLDRYQGRQKQTLIAWLQRSGRYLPKMQLVFASEGVPLDLAYLAMIESGFNVRAYSWAHAAGPWQFIESTGRMYGLTSDWWQDDRLDLEHSTRAAAQFLKDLHKRFDGDWYLAVAAYNAGPGRVSQAIRASGSRDFWDLADGKVLRAETVEYVPKLLAVCILSAIRKLMDLLTLNWQTLSITKWWWLKPRLIWHHRRIKRGQLSENCYLTRPSKLVDAAGGDKLSGSGAGGNSRAV